MGEQQQRDPASAPDVHPATHEAEPDGDPEVIIRGHGGHRVGVLPPGRAVQALGRSSVPPLDDWNF